MIADGPMTANTSGLTAAIRLRLGSLDLDAAFELAPGDVLAVLGPNGAGKSSLLRVLAGLQPLDAGSVVLDGVVLDATVLDSAHGPAAFVAPEQRPIGVMFQDYLLFPHLTALDNVAFGPRSRGRSKSEARSIAAGWIDRVGLAEFAGSKPSALSGGQAQRIALARALATDPTLLLLDEPLAALDASTKASVRRDLKRHLAAFEGVAVVVTHDPVDALALADHVMVIEAGSVTQVGTVRAVTERPRTAYVAELLGVNLLHGVAEDGIVELTHDSDERAVVHAASAPDGPVELLLRPNAIALHRTEPDTSARNVWSLVVDDIDLVGDHVRVRLVGALTLTAEITPAALATMQLVEGDAVWASVKATDIAAHSA